MTEQINHAAREAGVRSGEETDWSATNDELQGRVAQLEESIALRDTELLALKESLTGAVAKYRAAVLAGAPGVPGELVKGETLEEIDESLEKASAIVSGIRKHLQAEAQAIQVPAGAPGRQPVDLEGMSGEAMIAHALKTERR